MNNRYILAPLSFLVSAVIGGPSGAAESTEIVVPELCSQLVEPPSNEDGSEDASKFRALICRAENSFKKKQFVDSEKLYREALAIRFKDQPNFLPLLQLSATLVELGRFQEAGKDLQNLQCALDIIVGARACPRDLVLGEPTGTPFDCLPKCHQIMCSAAYSGHYGLLEQEDFELIEIYRRSASKLFEEVNRRLRRQ